MPKSNQAKPPGTSRPREYINPWKLFVGVFIPNWLMHRAEISLGAKLCYGQLCQHAGKEGNCFPSQETLAEELACSQRQVIRYLKELEKCALIEVKRVGLNRSNRYFFLKHKWMTPDVTDLSHPEVTNMLHQDLKDLSHPIVKESFKKNQATNQKNQVGWLAQNNQRGEESPLTPPQIDSYKVLVQKGVKPKVAKTLAQNHDLETITDVVESVCESGGVKNEPGLIVDRLNTIKETREKERETELKREQAELQAEREREEEWDRMKEQKEKELAEFHEWEKTHPGGTWAQFALATSS